MLPAAGIMEAEFDVGMNAAGMALEDVEPERCSTASLSGMACALSPPPPSQGRCVVLEHQSSA